MYAEAQQAFAAGHVAGEARQVLRPAPGGREDHDGPDPGEAKDAAKVADTQGSPIAQELGAHTGVAAARIGADDFKKERLRSRTSRPWRGHGAVGHDGMPKALRLARGMVEPTQLMLSG